MFFCLLVAAWSRPASAANKGSYLGPDAVLEQDDYLVSPNGLFFARMQSDGNFVVYRGPGPADAHGALWASGTQSKEGPFRAAMQRDSNFVVYKRNGALWASGVKGSAGAYYLYMQDDGNLVVYVGSSPDDGGKAVWASQARDPVKEIRDIQDVQYDLAKAVVEKDQAGEIFRRTFKNRSSLRQSERLSTTKTITGTDSWSRSAGLKVGASTTFKTDFPCLVKGEVKVSAEANANFSWEGATTRTDSWNIDEPLDIPPQTQVDAILTISTATLAVPYTAQATVEFESGTKMRTRFGGTYKGTSSHDLVVEIEEQSLATTLAKTGTKTKGLQAAPAPVVKRVLATKALPSAPLVKL